MNMMKFLLKLAAAAAAVAGIAYLVVKHMDKISAWVNKICPACPFTCDSEEVQAEPAEDAGTEEEAAPEEEPVETAVEEPAEHPAPEETVSIPENEPVAESKDFED